MQKKVLEFAMSSQNLFRIGRNSSIVTNHRCIHSSCSAFKIIPNNLTGKSKSSQEWLSRQLNDPYVKKAHEMNYRARSAFKLIEIDDKVKILKPGQIVLECGAAPGAWTQVIVQRINSDGKGTGIKKRRKGMGVGTVIGIDLLPIAPLEGAIFLDGCDFTSLESVQKIKDILAMNRKARIIGDSSINEEVGIGVRDGMVVGEVGRDELKFGEEVADKEDTGEGGNEKNGESTNGDTNGLVDVVLSDMAPNATGQRSTDHPRIVRLVESALVFAIKNGKSGGHFLAKVWDGSDVKRLEGFLEKYYEKVSRHKPPSSRSDSSELFILGKFKK
ncbi:unnamed protein product [Orchesella dallaii]|uniref:rRNA methyltransferase 2, mitochondrial n=1 Tax=Orchesella dallaii TaxID=48710 RepID=A0ABP1RD08_9HEXA